MRFISVLIFSVCLLHADVKLDPADSAMIDEAYRLWKSTGERIWPGWTKTSTPIVFVTAAHEFAIGFPRSLSGFEPAGRTATADVQSRTRTFNEGLAASFPFEGVPAAILGTPESLKKSRPEWIITATHEFFHVYEMTRGSLSKVASLEIGPSNDASWQLTFPFPYDDPNVMALLHLQAYLCYLAATTSNREDGLYQTGAALEAAGAYRRVLDDKAFRYSRFQEWNEGVAAYTEYRMAELAASSGAEYRKLWDDVYRNRIYLAKHAGRAAKSRTAFYHLGMAKALALDKLDPRWKERFFEPGVWMDDLLQAATNR